MFKNQTLQLFIGGITVLISTFAIITNNLDVLLLPLVQFILGLITVGMISFGISAYRRNTRRRAFGFLLVATLMLLIIITNNTMTMEGLVPVLTIYVVGGLPIGIIAIFANRLERNKSL